jgi:hypothetical protein
MHGGSSLVGVASPTFKHGRYSRHLPSRLAERYAEALADPQLLELRDEIALAGTRQTELLDQLDTGLSLGRWRAAQMAFGELMVAVRDKDTEGLQHALIALEDALGLHATNDALVWEQIVGLSEHRRRLVESEQKRLLAAQQLISAEQGMALIARLTESVRRYVSDPGILAAIANDLRAVVNAGTSERA